MTASQIQPTRTGNVLFLLIAITAPWFYLRWGGFSFSSGTSLSLVDVFLFAALIYFFIRMVRRDFDISVLWHGGIRDLLIIGAVFTALGLASAFTRVWAHDAQELNWAALLSGLSQYAFVLLALPVIALVTIGGRSARHAMRWIAFGYFWPMVINMILLRQDILPDISMMFVSVGRAIGSYGNANSFAGVIMLVLPFYFYLSFTDRGWWRVLGTIGAALSLTCLLLSASFGGILVLLGCAAANAGLLLLWKEHPLRASHRPAIIQTLVILGLAGVLLAMASFYAQDVRAAMEGRFGDAAGSLAGDPLEKIGSANQRIELMERGITLLPGRGGGLFYGHGLRQTTFMPEFVFGNVSLDVHFVYLLLWIEGGLILALAFIAYLAALMRACLAALRTAPAATIAVGTSVVAFILMGFVMPHIYLRYFWVPMIPALGLATACMPLVAGAADRFRALGQGAEATGLVSEQQR